MASLRKTATTTTTTSSSSTTPAGTPEHVPAPWTLKGDMYWLPLRLTNPLPSNVYHPLDIPSSSSTSPSSNFAGGFGTIQIIRYSDSPVGPYDELMLIPGEFAVPGGEWKGKSKMRISRIYVSQRETCYNGRLNWNIPKHLARFEFSSPPPTHQNNHKSSSPQELRVSVFQPNDDTTTKPFFTATLTPAKYLPTFPLSTNYLPLDTTLVQPPLPAGNEPMLVGTETWKVCRLEVWSSRACLMWVESPSSSSSSSSSTKKKKDDDDNDDGSSSSRESDGVSSWWPEMVQPWGMGLWVEDAVIEMVEAEEFSV